MNKIILTSGLIAGTILAIMIVAMVPAFKSGSVDVERGELLGYTTMVVAFLAVFVGVRAYRERNGGGTITFKRAFKVGILITLIASAIHVVTWQIVYFNFIPDFGELYAQHMIEKMRAQGATAAAIEAEMVKMKQFAELYKNPLFNAGITFLEVFPVGLIVTLISAAILRRTPTDSSATATEAA